LVEATYKYHSDRKRFARLPAVTMSLSVDAFSIPGHLRPPRRPGGNKAPATPK
ncbi:CAMP3 protein, partial [Pluvianellus socialis]|nr:CAMP3 protein [Pluvianellus socialis]